MIPSPCIKLCVFDHARGLCAGCLRTLEEITGWPTMSDAQKAAVLAELARREQDQGPPNSQSASPATPPGANKA